MRYTLAAAAIAGVASAAWSHGDDSWGSWGPPSNGTDEVYVTEVVTAFTTFCPEATVITAGSSTWSASASETITITGPVTITKPVYTSVITSCTTCSTAVPVTSAAPVTTSKSTPSGTGVWSKPSASGVWSKKPVPSGSASGTGVWSTTTGTAPIATYTGAASHLQAGAAGAIAVIGLIAAL